MKKITYLVLLLACTSIYNSNSQTIAWSSDSEDYVNWPIVDSDGDSNAWGVYTGGLESLGFTGAAFSSDSWSTDPSPDGTALTPDNRLFTPASSIAIPANATSINFKMKVNAYDVNFFAEKYAIYVADEDEETLTFEIIFGETLTAGGDGNAKDITASVPISYAGKNLIFLIRHYDCTNQNQLLVDDFEVSYSTSLSTKNNTLEISKVFPNPVQDILNIKTNDIIEKITVTNQLGQRVLIIEKDNIINNSVNLSNLAKGLYLVKVEANNKASVIKIIKQ